MTVMIGVDPHKRTHTAVVIDRRGDAAGAMQGARRRERRSRSCWRGRATFEDRTWAIESANGLGYLLGQQLVAAGERVAGRAGDVVGAGAGVGDGAFEQERPERRAVGRDRALGRAAVTMVQAADHRWCCGCW